MVSNAPLMWVLLTHHQDGCYFALNNSMANASVVAPMSSPTIN